MESLGGVEHLKPKFYTEMKPLKIGDGADHIAEKLGLWYKVETIKEHPATLLDTTKIQGTNFIEFCILNILMKQFEVDIYLIKPI